MSSTRAVAVAVIIQPVSALLRVSVPARPGPAASWARQRPAWRLPGRPGKRSKATGPGLAALSGPCPARNTNSVQSIALHACRPAFLGRCLQKFQGSNKRHDLCRFVQTGRNSKESVEACTKIQLLALPPALHGIFSAMRFERFTCGKSLMHCLSAPVTLENLLSGFAARNAGS